MAFDYNKYYTEYRKNTSTVTMVLNLKHPDDIKIMEILNKQPNKTRFIKKLILDGVNNENK